MDCRRRATPGYICDLGDADLLERCGRLSPAARSTRRRRLAVCLEKLGGCLSSARAGQRPRAGGKHKSTRPCASTPRSR
eukprot:969098-Prymnesium_polylepis.1